MYKCQNNGCNKYLKYNSNWDSHYCDKCDIWTDKKCDDVDCTYCNIRPEKPSLVQTKTFDEE
jgi:hypothetical protein